MNLFIDTNIYLSFYHLTNDDLEELKKLSVLIDKDEIKLLITRQVIDEFTRNRESKIADAVKRLREQKLNLQFPQLCKDYPEYGKLRDLQKNYEIEHSILMQKISDDVTNNTLKADAIIKKLFLKSEKVEMTSELIQRAQLRVDIGNPPGKKGSIGDAINWEAMLSSGKEWDDFYFVTDDKDFYSELDDKKPREFLVKEWDNENFGKVHFYRQLSSFFKKFFPEIILASALEKEFLLNTLVSSKNFATTHSAISGLSEYDDYNSQEIDTILSAAVLNTQVRWIIEDEDVNAFIKRIITNFRDEINPQLLEQIEELLKDKN